MNPIIKVENLSKQYRIGTHLDSYRTLRDTIMAALAAPWRSLRRLPGLGSSHESSRDGKSAGEMFWALQNVSFEVQPGEVVGIIGRNGAGKSTLLKVLSRITEPTSGRVTLRGRVGSLLEVGTGFHSELTGRENIYLNGAILGMSQREIARKFDEIVAFAEIDQFLDTPVKRYSSGMYVRLAFAVAAHLELEILIVDEVLAVGDNSFQRKCLGKMDEAGHSGRTILYVSHNMASVLNLCQKVIVLDTGRVIFAGTAEEGVRRYMGLCHATRGAKIDLLSHPNRRHGSTPI